MACVNCNKQWPIVAAPMYCLYCGTKQPELSKFQVALIEAEAEKEFKDQYGINLTVIARSVNPPPCTKQQHAAMTRLVKSLGPEYKDIVFCPKCGKKFPKV